MKKKWKSRLYLIVCIVLGVVFVVSATATGVTLYRYHQADELYGDLQDKFVTKGPARPPQVGSEEEPLEPPPITVDLAALTGENADAVGWLYCEGTPINYPVVQSRDNEDYLHKDIHKKYLYSGTLFIDFRCTDVGEDQNHIIYGHHMKNGTMFGTLVRYKEQSYFDEHPALYYLTVNGNYKIELFAGCIIKSTDDAYQPNFGTAEDFDKELQTILKKSTFTSDVSVTAEDRIVTLSTCSYEFNNARYVVFGKLTRIADS